MGIQHATFIKHRPSRTYQKGVNYNYNPQKEMNHYEKKTSLCR